MQGTKFTDNNLKLYYGNLLKHYQSCHDRLYPDIGAIYDEMYLATQFTLESPTGSLYGLDREEKNKVYHSFNTVFRALPIYTGLSPEQRRSFNPLPRPYNPTVVYVYNDYNRYRFNDSLLFNWMLLSSMTHQCHHHHRGPSYPYPGNVHGHPSTNGGNRRNDSKDTSGEVIALLIIIALAAAAAVATVVALYYMLDEFLNSSERLLYNEGWLKAALMLATATAFGAASTVMSLTLASVPLVALALAAGLNPVGVVIVGAICLTIIGAGIGTFAMSMLYDFIDRKVNSDAMDPNDSARFQLTEADEQALTVKKIDPIKVKCAMVALRAEMSNLLESNDKIPSFFSRHYGKGEKIQELLKQVRELRSGVISAVKVGDLNFDCVMVHYAQQPTPPVNTQSAMQPIPIPSYLASSQPSETVDYSYPQP
jgi:hypothetical protein